MEVWSILILNTLFSILFFYFVKDKQQRIFSLFFLVLPFFGIVLYFIPKYIFQLTQKHNLYDISNIKLKINEETFSQKPNIPEEMNIVSFNEVMQIGQKEEKRAFLLNVLKDNLIDNASFIRSAMSDSDSETTHYAASATMQIYTKLRAAIQALETQLQLDPDNSSISKELLRAICDYILSGVLTARENEFYRNKYVRTFNKLKDIEPSLLSCEDYLNQSDFLFKDHDVHQSILNAINARDRFDQEEAHLKLLELYYKTGNQNKFDEAFDVFKKSKLTVSNNGLELIRFWGKRAL
ncbi:MAG TPA: hypothetical protein VFH18_06580 [Erysipelotrichaceae bacterium]|nr:hypothetical protein [Erysipelotrichaceae bacterium]